MKVLPRHEVDVVVAAVEVFENDELAVAGHDLVAGRAQPTAVDQCEDFIRRTVAQLGAGDNFVAVIVLPTETAATTSGIAMKDGLTISSDDVGAEHALLSRA